MLIWIIITNSPESSVFRGLPDFHLNLKRSCHHYPASQREREVGGEGERNTPGTVCRHCGIKYVCIPEKCVPGLNPGLSLVCFHPEGETEECVCQWMDYHTDLSVTVNSNHDKAINHENCALSWFCNFFSFFLRRKLLRRIILQQYW